MRSVVIEEHGESIVHVAKKEFFFDVQYVGADLTCFIEESEGDRSEVMRFTCLDDKDAIPDASWDVVGTRVRNNRATHVIMKRTLK